MEVLQLEDLMIENKVQTILTEAKLDWSIDKIQLTGVHNEKIINSGYVGLVNSKTQKVLHAAKPSYTPCQNDELVRILMKGSQAFGNLKYNWGGAMNGGKKIFLNLKIADAYSVRGEELKRYVTGINSNDGSAAVSFGYGNTVPSCDNQFRKFLRERFHKIYHNSSMDEKLEQVPEILYHILEEELQLMKIYSELAETNISKDLANDLVKSLIGYDRTATKEELEDMGIKQRSLNIMNSLHNAIDFEIKDKGENMWGLFNGVTRFTTHDKSVPKRSFGREESLYFGSGATMNNDALQFVMKEAELTF